MRNLVTILILVFFASCSRKMLPTIQTVIKDSIIETEKIVHIRDTAYLPGDSVEMWMAIPCPEAKMDRVIKQGNTTLSAKIANGFIHIDCRTDSLQHIIDSLTIKRNKEVYKTTVQQVPVELIKYRVPKWCWWLLIGIIVYFGIKYRNPVFSFFKGFIK